MVKPIIPQPTDEKRHSNWLRWILPIAIIGVVLYFSLPSFIELDEDGNFALSEERLRDYREKPQRSEEVEVYKLVATVRGLYKCFSCPGVKAVRLNSGEVWKYGITRSGKRRYTKGYYLEHKVEYIPIITTDILNAEQLEKQLIISYPMLPECQKRMKMHGIFLKRPPGNTKDQ
jgi:hypothetical protein